MDWIYLGKTLDEWGKTSGKEWDRVSIEDKLVITNKIRERIREQSKREQEQKEREERLRDDLQFELNLTRDLTLQRGGSEVLQNTPYTYERFCEKSKAWSANYLNDWDRVWAEVKRFHGSILCYFEMPRVFAYYRSPYQVQVLGSIISEEQIWARFHPILDAFNRDRISESDALDQIRAIRHYLEDLFHKTLRQMIKQSEKEEFAKLSAELSGESPEAKTETPAAIVPAPAANPPPQRLTGRSFFGLIHRKLRG